MIDSAFLSHLHIIFRRFSYTKCLKEGFAITCCFVADLTTLCRIQVRGLGTLCKCVTRAVKEDRPITRGLVKELPKRWEEIKICEDSCILLIIET